MPAETFPSSEAQTVVKLLKNLPFDAVWQAEKLLDFTRRGGDAARWWQSKDFSPADRHMIEDAVILLQQRERPCQR
jgi:hypothetical protein